MCITGNLRLDFLRLQISSCSHRSGRALGEPNSKFENCSKNENNRHFMLIKVQKLSEINQVIISQCQLL